jgi:hypothetical protein
MNISVRSAIFDRLERRNELSVLRGWRSRHKS